MPRDMAQAWHRPRERRALAEGAEAKCWRATKYRINNLSNLGDPANLGDPPELVYKLDNLYKPANLGDPVTIEAAPDAAWGRFTPFDLYEPTSWARKVEAGPHLKFLKLKGFMKEQPPRFPHALILFVREYGLLGVFEEDHLQRPILPRGKMLVAPEAVIDEQGRLQRVDPATEGKELILELLEPEGWFQGFENTEHKYSCIALPSEIHFIPKNPGFDSYGWPRPYRQFVPWEEIREDFGALMILDEEYYKGVSVLCTREPLRRWIRSLSSFPSGNTPVERLVREHHNSFNWHLREVSPCFLRGEGGNAERGWYYSSLLAAMYAMLWMDITGGNAIRECQSKGCSNYFRIGSQSKSKYCSERCANRASTRMRRGQEP